nr:hypothetical protein [Tanacetum cinerariifolium]
DLLGFLNVEISSLRIMATTIEQQTALDKTLVPSSQRINIDFAYLIWEDFVYQVEHKSQKRSNEMNYPRFTKVIIDYFMTRKPSISRRNRIHWHYVRDDALFSTIKVVSRHQATQQYGAILPIELTTAEIRNSEAYQEYYAYAMGEAAPKPKASARRRRVILLLPLLLLLQHQQPQLNGDEDDDEDDD